MGRTAALGLALLVGAALPAWAAPSDEKGDWNTDRGQQAGQEHADRGNRWSAPYTPQGYYAPPPVYYNEPGLAFFIPFH